MDLPSQTGKGIFDQKLLSFVFMLSLVDLGPPDPSLLPGALGAFLGNIKSIYSSWSVLEFYFPSGLIRATDPLRFSSADL